jgi:uncharacterized protein YbjT (DUF2867 family)
MSRAVIVTGATGKQGGAVLDALIDANADFEILAVSRNVQSVAAQKLKQKSPKVKPMEGDMNNPIVLFKTAQKVTSLPIWGVFSVQVRYIPDPTRIADPPEAKPRETRRRWPLVRMLP